MNATEEPGTLVYNVYLNDDETLFTYLKRITIPKPASFMPTICRRWYISQILERTDGGRLCFYGAVSDEFKQWAADNGFELNIST